MFFFKRLDGYTDPRDVKRKKVDQKYFVRSVWEKLQSGSVKSATVCLRNAKSFRAIYIYIRDDQTLSYGKNRS